MTLCPTIQICNKFYTHWAGAEGSFEYKSLITLPFFLSGPNCSGSEQHLIDCPGSEIENSTSCSHTSVVHCSGINIITLLWVSGIILCFIQCHAPF